MKRARLAVVAAAVLVGGGYAFFWRAQSTCGGTAVRPRAGVVMADETKAGFLFHLSEGAEEGGARTPVPQAESRPLSEAEARAVLDRLPPFTAPAEEKDFA